MANSRNPKTPPRQKLTYYSARQAPADSPFEKTSRSPKRRLFSKAIDFLIVAAVLAAIAYSLIVSPNPKIELDSEVYHPISAYRQAATAALGSFHNRNKLTFNDKDLILNLQRQFPEISNASVDLSLFGETPKLKLTIAAPSFFINSQGVNYVVDSEGVAVDRSTALPRIKNLPIIIDQTGFNSRAGTRVLSAQAVRFINVVINQTKHAKIPIASMTLPALAQELDLRTSDRGYFVKLYLGGDPLVQTGQFLAARHQFDQTNNQPSQYLDVRVPGKIYFK